MKDIILISSIAGILGTGIGGILGIIFGSKTIGKTLAFTGGIMLGVVFYDLIPMSLTASNLFVTVVSILIGVLFICLTDLVISSRSNDKELTKEQNYINMGMIMLITMALHNFPEGMAIGSSSAYSLKSGLVVALVIAAHDIPEGMSIATPLSGGRMNKQKIFILTILSGFSTILGAIIGLWIGKISDMTLGLCLGLAAGAMIYVVFGELIPDSLNTISKKNMALMTIGGIIFSLILLIILN